MTFVSVGKKCRNMQKSLGALEAGFTPGMFEASRIQAKMKTNLAKVKDSKISHKIDLKHI
jgi:hypothetical protein